MLAKNRYELITIMNEGIQFANMRNNLQVSLAI